MLQSKLRWGRPERSCGAHARSCLLHHEWCMTAGQSHDWKSPVCVIVGSPARQEALSGPRTVLDERGYATKALQRIAWQTTEALQGLNSNLVEIHAV